MSATTSTPAGLPAGAGPIPELPGIAVEHEFYDLPAGRFHVARAGDRSLPAVLLVHGFPQHWWCWRGVIQELAAELHLVMPDLRGSGGARCRRRRLLPQERARWRPPRAAGRDGDRADRGRRPRLGRLRLAAPRARPPGARHPAARALHPAGDPGSPPAAARDAADVLPARLRGARLRRAHLRMPSRLARGIRQDVQRRDAFTREDAAAFAEPYRDPQRAKAAQMMYRSFVMGDAAKIYARTRTQRFAMPVRFVLSAFDAYIPPHFAEDAPRTGIRWRRSSRTAPGTSSRTRTRRTSPSRSGSSCSRTPPRSADHGGRLRSAGPVRLAGLALPLALLTLLGLARLPAGLASPANMFFGAPRPTASRSSGRPGAARRSSPTASPESRMIHHAAPASSSTATITRPISRELRSRRCSKSRAPTPRPPAPARPAPWSAAAARSAARQHWRARPRSSRRQAGARSGEAARARGGDWELEQGSARPRERTGCRRRSIALHGRKAALAGPLSRLVGMAQRQRQVRTQMTSSIASMQDLEQRSDEELENETRHRAAAQALLGARAAQRYDAEKAKEHFRRAIAAARPQERMQIRRMADASIALAERRPDALKSSLERLGQEAPSGRQLFLLACSGSSLRPRAPAPGHACGASCSSCCSSSPSSRWHSGSYRSCSGRSPT